MNSVWFEFGAAAAAGAAAMGGRLMFERQLNNYAPIDGSSKFRQFVEGRRAYLTTAASTA